MVEIPYPKNTIWYLEARHWNGSRERPEIASPSPELMGSGVVVSLEHLDSNGKSKNPAVVKKYILTCAHTVRECNWGRPYGEILCWPHAAPYVSPTTIGRSRLSGEQLGAYLARVSEFSPGGSSEAVPREMQIDANDWALLEVEGPHFQAMEHAKTWGIADRDMVFKIWGFPDGAPGFATHKDGLSNLHVIDSVQCHPTEDVRLGRRSPPGTYGLDGNFQKAPGTSGGAAFSVGSEFIGIHRAAYAEGKQRILVAASSISSWLSNNCQIRPAISAAFAAATLHSRRYAGEPSRIPTENYEAVLGALDRGRVNVYGSRLSGKSHLLDEIAHANHERFERTIVCDPNVQGELRLASFLEALEEALQQTVASNAPTIVRIRECRKIVSRRSIRLLFVVDRYDELISGSSEDVRKELNLLFSEACLLTATDSRCSNSSAMRQFKMKGLKPADARLLVTDRLNGLEHSFIDAVADFIERQTDLRPGLILKFLNTLNRPADSTPVEKFDLKDVWDNLAEYRAEQLRGIDSRSKEILLIAERVGSTDPVLLSEILDHSAAETPSEIAGALQKLAENGISPLSGSWVYAAGEFRTDHALLLSIDTKLVVWANRRVAGLQHWERDKKVYDQAERLWRPMHRVLSNFLDSGGDAKTEDPYSKTWITIARIVHHFGPWDVVEKTLEDLCNRGGKRAMLEARLEYVRYLSYRADSKETKAKVNEEATALLRECDEAGYDGLHARVLLRLGQIQMSMDEADEARTSLRKAIEANRIRDFLVAAGFLAELEIRHEAYDRADELLTAAALMQRLVDKPWWRIQAHHLRLEATLALARGDWPLAKQKYTDVKKLADNWAVDQRLDGWALAGLALCENDTEIALKAADSARSVFQRLGLAFKEDMARTDRLTNFLRSNITPTIFLLGSPAAGKTTQSKRIRRWLTTQLGVPATGISIDDAQKLTYPRRNQADGSYIYTEHGALLLSDPRNQVPPAYDCLCSELARLRQQRHWIVVVEFAHPSTRDIFKKFNGFFDGDSTMVIYLETSTETRVQRNSGRLSTADYIPPHIVQEYASQPEEAGQLGLPWTRVDANGNESDTFEAIKSFIKPRLDKWLS